MPATDGERIARNESRIEDIRARLLALEQELEEVSSRNRKTEWAVKLIVDAHRNAQELEARRQRRIEVRLEILAAVIATAAVLVSIVFGVIH